MLPKCYRDYDRELLPLIQKTVSQEDASDTGAFSFGTVITYTVTLPRALGAAAVVLRLHADGQAEHDTPLTFTRTQGGIDTYQVSVDTAALCRTTGQEYGLFYYEFLFVRGMDTLFTSTVNNRDFTLCDHSEHQFRLLVYEKDYTPPAWFFGGLMYHVFVDRFCRGVGEVRLREDATLEEDWEHGIPQYGAYPGAPVANNRFFGGNLWGVAEKLDYLQSLGVTVLYLSPIFESASNHKYDTGDYETVDALFGGEAALEHLIGKARARGIRIVLDGVFNHTGDDSRYFNRYGRYAECGAYQSPDSPYADWYDFKNYPDEYECWWGIPILPRLNSNHSAIRAYLAGKDGIAARRIRQGVAGWRLDVVDELSDAFLDELRASLHTASDEQPLIIGEVWENAADKLAYGHRRRYFLGKQLDSVMNYPLRNGLLAFVRDGDAEALYNILTELYTSYPRPVCHALMNLLGTHDTERILTVLGDPCVGDDRTNDELSVARLTSDQRRHGLSGLRMAFTLLFTVFGVPSLYYGDEAGMEGHHDPFCRLPFPWGREDDTTLSHVRFLGKLRREHPCLATGDFRILSHDAHSIVYERCYGNDHLLVAANMADKPLTLSLNALYQPLTSTRLLSPTKNYCVEHGEAVILQEVAT